MSHHNHPEQSQSHHVRRVVLPSGKTIEVVYFDASLAPAEQAHGFEAGHVVDDTVVDLSRCPSCECDLVYPVDWAEANPGHWEVDLRCPNCEWHESGVYSQDVVDRFDMTLDGGTEALIDDLQALIRANMEEEIDRFVTALSCGHILPEDF